MSIIIIWSSHNNNPSEGTSMSTNPKPPKYLLIKLLQFQQLSPQQQNMIYFSFSTNETMYFSSCMPTSSGALTDDIIMTIEDNQKIETIDLCRWQNHMIMLTHHIDLSQLRSRSTIVKKMETKYGQYLKMLVVSLQEQELKFGLKYLESITQHYLFIDQLSLISNAANQNDNGPSYFKIKTENSTYVMPVMDGQLLIKLPETLQFYRIKNGKQVGISSKFSSTQLREQQKIISLDSKNGYKFSDSIKMKLKWGINLQQSKPQNVLLLDSQQIMIYDLEIKFENANDYGNSKLKIVYGNKAFELGSELNTAKSSKIRKIVNLIAKSEDEELIIMVEKNLKVYAQSKLIVEQLTPFVVNSIKKKILDTAGKPIGSIKFKCEKAKNLSTPSNNKMWRQGIKTRNVGSQFLLLLDQFSVEYNEDIPILLSLKTQSQQKFIKKIPNVMHFNKNQSVVAISPLALTLKSDESVYMVAKNAKEESSQNNQSDFIGIALFNPSEARFGLSCGEIKFFKNQVHTLIMNCMINKIASYPFIKPTFQPEILQSLSHRSISLSVIMRQVYFSPYFYTYRYDNKNQVYCIVEVNKQKKVLIMENKNKSNELSFNCSASSDNLDFSVEQTETIKMKITFLVSDIGQDQEIYGWSLIKIKTAELQASTSSLKFYLMEIKNDFGGGLGQINVEVNKASLFNSHVKQSRDILESGTRLVQNEKRKVKMHLAQIGQSVELKQKSFEAPKNQGVNKNPSLKQEMPLVKKPSARYEKIPPLPSNQRRKRNNSVIGIEGSIKLPAIREESASPQGKKNYNQLVQMMKIRKRSMKGHYEENSMLESYQMRNYNNKGHLTGNYKLDDTPSIQLFQLKDKIEKQNPNISRNMEILFPKKSPRMEKSIPLKRPIRYEQEKLKGLKSVLNEITSDIGQIEPTVKDEDRFLKQESKKSEKINNEDNINHLEGPQWDDNEFAM